MPRWLINMLRMSVIGVGVTMMLLAGINLYALHQLFDVSAENQLGFSATELRPLFYVLAIIGASLTLLGALVRVPKALLEAKVAGRKPPPRTKPRT